MADAAGRIWFDETPGWHFYHDDGSMWVKWGLLNQLVVPAGSFAWLNQGSATVDATAGAIILAMPAPGSSGDNIHARTIAPIATPYGLDAGFIPQIDAFNNTSCGLILRESSTSKIIFLSLFFDKNNSKSDTLVSLDKFTNETTLSGNYTKVSANVLKGPTVWFRIKNDGTNFSWLISSDGVNFESIFTSAVNNFFTTTADQIGFAVNSNTTSGGVAMTLLSWENYLLV